jgi:tight adherence protein B
MLQLILVVFAGAFLVTALLLAAAGAGASQQRKATLARLDSVSVTSKEAILDETAIIKRDDLLSPIPWLDRWLRTMDIFGRVRLLLEQAGLNWTAGGLLFASFGCAALAAAAVYLRTRLIVLSLLLALLAACIPWFWVLRKRSIRFDAFEEMLPEALDLMVSALRAGHGLTAAIGTVAKEMSDPIAKEFRQCFDEQNFGLELKAAMLNLVARVPIQDVRIIVTAVLVQKESGGNLAEVLDKVATVIRERFRLKRQIRVHTAQGRLTGWILACLPPVLGCALYLVKPEYLSVLWTTPLGLKMLYGGTILMVIGALIIRKIVRVRV